MKKRAIRKKGLKILQALFIFVATFVSSVPAQELSFPGEPVFFDELLPQVELRLNELRKAPLREAEALGVSEEEILAGWGEAGFWHLSGGFSELCLEESLVKVARERFEEMLNGNFSGLSSPEEAAREAGYPPLLIGESLAYILFENYLPPEEALEILLSRLFRGALRRTLPQGAPLLFPLYEDLGASFVGGRLLLDGKEYNFYALYLVLGLRGDTRRPVLVGRIFPPFEGASLTVFQGGRRLQALIYPDGSYFLEGLLPGEFALLLDRGGKRVGYLLYFTGPMRFDPR